VQAAAKAGGEIALAVRKKKIRRAARESFVWAASEELFSALFCARHPAGT